MVSSQREKEILDLLAIKKTVTVSLLCQKLYASSATIRRDLGRLERRGLIRRTRGGAVLAEGGNDEVSVFERQSENAREKTAIGRLASYFIKDGYTVFMDSSSTVCCAAPFLLPVKRLSVITNGLHCALALSAGTGCEVYMPAGRLLSRSNSLAGTDTLSSLSGFCAEAALVSCSGLTVREGVTEPVVEQSRIKLQMLRQARTKILLCDHTKFGRICMNKTCDIGLFDYLITDCRPEEETCAAIEESGCELVYPGS
ncbi:MAG: DeoR/GlpR transcriptional regulator [Provencibacterium sp.]|jgi:DeoR/GlpR family transcriptional regulator of sugar metabolism|nr:DeoR/GlpR transcriptional regulator [Provencibacterium sp.]